MFFFFFFLISTWYGDYELEVRHNDFGEKFNVNFNTNKCWWRKWMLVGLSCSHVISYLFLYDEHIFFMNYFLTMSITTREYDSQTIYLCQAFQVNFNF